MIFSTPLYTSYEITENLGDAIILAGQEFDDVSHLGVSVGQESTSFIKGQAKTLWVFLRFVKTKSRRHWLAASRSHYTIEDLLFLLDLSLLILWYTSSCLDVHHSVCLSLSVCACVFKHVTCIAHCYDLFGAVIFISLYLWITL